jgi:hypothetical protein
VKSKKQALVFIASDAILLRQALLFWKYTPTNPIFRACLKQEREIVPKGLFRLTPPKNSFSSGSGEILWGRPQV